MEKGILPAGFIRIKVGGERGDPCGIPVAVSYSPDLWPLIMMRVYLFLRKLAIQVTLRSGGFKLICYTTVYLGIILFS
jgi:hypothetical protein